MRLLPISRLCEFYTSIANRFKTSLFASVMQLVKGHCVSFFLMWIMCSMFCDKLMLTLQSIFFLLQFTV